MYQYLYILQILATLLAATLHDVQHPGLDAGFLCATNHDLALMYNDKVRGVFFVSHSLSLSLFIFIYV